MEKRHAWALIIAYIPALLGSLVLYLVGSVGLIRGPPDAPTVDPGKLLLLSIAFLLLLAAAALLVTWFATQNRDMNRLTGGSFNTLLWTILLFVPIAHFVSLYMFADHIRRAQSTVGVTGMPPVATFLILLLSWAVLLPFIGLIVAQIQLDKLGARRVDRAVAPPPPTPTVTPSGFLRIEEPTYYTRAPIARGERRPQPWPEDWPAPAWNEEENGAPHPPGIGAEVLPMPAAGILMMFLGVASIPFAVTGPAGVFAGTIALVARRRLLALEATSPGHRGVRATRWSDKVAWIGIALGGLMTIVILILALAPLLTS